jgi:hypothetical protein
MNLLPSLLTAFVTASSPAQHPAMPAGTTHEQHLAQLKKEEDLKKRGAAAMGFDQNNATHHFVLNANGGNIEVAANDPSDQESRDQIRAHLKDIAAEFARGSFARPLATHNELPPGVRAMQQRQQAIAYQYEDTANGGRVRISTADRKGIAAIHEFLRYQIREHATGDPLK